MIASRKLIIKISLALIIITSLPYLYGWLIKPSGTVFMGNNIFNSHDNFVYYAYIAQAKNGHLLNWDAFTTEQQLPFLNWLWLIIGISANIFNLTPIFAFHLWRIVLIPVFVWTIYCFVSYAYRKEPQAKRLTAWAMILIFFSTGAGAYLRLLSNSDFLVDEFIIEAYALWSAFFSPHFLASWILLIWSMYFFLRGWEENKTKLILVGGVLGMALCQFHPFYLALLPPLTLIHVFWNWRENHWSGIKKAFCYLIWLLPIVIYQAALIRLDPTTSFRLFENRMFTPDPLLILFSYGILVPIAYFNIGQKFQKSMTCAERWLILWALATPLLLYAPVPFQRRLIEAWQLPIVILAVPILSRWYDWLGRKLKSDAPTYCTALAILVFFISPWKTWASCIATYHIETGQNFYYPSADIQALQWLDKFDTQPTILFSSPFTGQINAFTTNKKTFLGHGFETIRAKEKSLFLKNFLADNQYDAEKKEFLKQWDITYLFWGATEKKYGDFQPDGKDYLEKIYNENQVSIYRVKL